ncbi:MAG: 1-deoxy-D-xylulose-5-phosphate reductoisomerase [Clostridiales bacterium]|nr:1-deoxy-D-xylulose-5-phosphate reductoisomerase [Clostridiales bacterium]
MKNIAVLGCTGSIGRQTLDIVRSNPDKYRITGLSCGSRVTELVGLSREFSCKNVGVYDKTKYTELKALVPNANAFCGDDALTAVIDGADTVVIAVVGMIGLKAVLYALEKGKAIALANKESLVAGGSIVTERLKHGGKLYPVDSEHSAVWQCLQGEKDFSRIILTASGGPFYFAPQSELYSVTPEQAVKHPNWSMGQKISVDSATMMNKGLEIIEARWLFNTTDIDYVIHPESVVHSMVEFRDGSIKAQAGFPDMRLPIQYALSYPEHSYRNFTPLSLPMELRFLPPDENKFPAPKLAKQAIVAGGNSAAVLNAANEAAVALFLQRKIAFTDIVRIVEDALSAEPHCEVKTADEVFATHNRVYDQIYLKYRGR